MAQRVSEEGMEKRPSLEQKSGLARQSIIGIGKDEATHA